jgi:hypothetical protein
MPVQKWLGKHIVANRLAANLLAQTMDRNQALMWRAAVFPQVNALPGAKRQPALHDWDGEAGCGECGSDVCRHIVIALRGMDKQRVAILDEPVEKALQIPPDIRVCIFLNQQRGRGVTDLEREQAVLKLVLRHPVSDLIGELIEPAASRAYSYFV